jgi:hypothetical protein
MDLTSDEVSWSRRVILDMEQGVEDGTCARQREPRIKQRKILDGVLQRCSHASINNKSST